MAVIEERIGNIFDSPPNSVLIHACNTKGHWGAGVALAFKKYSPSAYHRQKRHCTGPARPNQNTTKHRESLLGKCLLIAPQRSRSTVTAVDTNSYDSEPTPAEEEKRFWIACLFTSRSYGKNVDTPDSILEATASAVEDLRVQIDAFHAEKEELERHVEGDKRRTEGRTWCEEDVMRLEMGDCYSVRINSGLFGVPWQKTKAVLEKAGLDMVVVRPPDEEKKTARKRKATE
ncbi:MAG: hypothetical protein Q9179_005937 [Wetmoreana sp. 5 TL-2023]